MRTRLSPALALLWAALLVYGSLYPFAGWRDSGAPPWAFAIAPWPRYWTVADLLLNVLAYLPLGFLVALAAGEAANRARAWLVAATAGAALSFVLECAQSYLATRIASVADWAANTAGAALGASAAVAIGSRLRSGPLGRLRRSAFAPGRAADAVIVLLALWLFAQLHPAALLFGAGDLREVLGLATTAAHEPALFVRIETATAAANVVAVSLLVSAAMTPGAPVRRFVLALLVLALALRTLAFAVLVLPQQALAWWTPGAAQGLTLGALTALVATALPRTVRIVLAAVLVAAATALVNLAPPNPYHAEFFRPWAQGHFWHFNGLTRLVSALWPFAALATLVALARAR